jgi:hypothetical protein
MSRFAYIADKIVTAQFEEQPFRHLYIEDLFNYEDFLGIINSREVNIAPVKSDEELITALHQNNFKEIEFPGTTTDLNAYLKWHANPDAEGHSNQATCEGVGVTMRLQAVQKDTLLAEACEFFESDLFWKTVTDKFGLQLARVRKDVGIQKYLDGYEISPHPDVRRKALSFMININPAPNSEDISYHTQYLTFKPEHDYIRRFWINDTSSERCWVPWDWCEPRKTQTKNNSIVIFSPDNNTIHAVKASYDHLKTQRTQFYGNLWYNDVHTKTRPRFAELPEVARAYTSPPKD